MTKKSDAVLSSPNRQSYVAVLLILGRTFIAVFRQAMPIFLVLLFRQNPEEDQPPVFLYAGLALVVLVMLWSMLQFIMTRFYVQYDELIVHSGVLQKKKTSIPLERIQTVHLEQSFVHQIFDVFRIQIETAGSDKSEVRLLAVPAHIAGAIRELAVQKVDSGTHDTNSAVIDAEEAGTGIAAKTLKNRWLYHDVFAVIRIGLTQHHLKSGWLIILFLIWMYDNLQQAGIRLENYAHLAEEWQPGLWLFTFF
ncbi:MAG: PH domain-containing protein, partial [Saprospiraceae bacterium]|nr:PH domain-containing protein [Saprospiraceae bacterium]